MNDSWLEFLGASGAVVSDGAVAHFGHPEAEPKATSEGGVISDLSHGGLIAAQGADATSFLQGQLTCDVDALDISHSLLGAWCSPKGRVLTLFRLLQQRDRILMALPRSRLAPSLQRLRMFVLRARVSLEDVSDQFVRVGLYGEAAEKLLHQQFGELPQEPDRAVGANGVCIVKLRGIGPRFEIYLDDVDRGKALWQSAAKSLTSVGTAAWDVLDIVSGLPQVTEEDEYLPQMLNLDQIGGLSFTKGCYVGQEIVARTHHLGRLKRRMFRLNFDSEIPPAQNAPLYRDGSKQGGEADGRLLVARPGASGGYEALAVIKIESADLRLRLGAADGIAVNIVPFADAGDFG